MNAVWQIHQLLSGVSSWLIILLVVVGLGSIYLFAKLFESDFFNDKD